MHSKGGILLLPWSDNWWIEGQKAYFCGAEIAALFSVDLEHLQCSLVAKIPEGKWKDFRLNPFCIKFNDCIYCFPCRGNDIWYYNLPNAQWGKIELETETGTIKNVFPEICNGKVWVRNCQNGKISGINLSKKSVEDEYRIPVIDGGSHGRYTMVHDELYCVNANRIYRINTKTREITEYDLSELRTVLFTIFYDGKNFWLSGNRKIIYIWNPDNGIIKSFAEFPEQFGVYQYDKENKMELNFEPNRDNKNFLFDHSIGVGKYVWFIPFFANRLIYIDRESYCIHTLNIDEEQGETGKKRQGKMNRILLEYVRSNRYIGIYSSNDDRIVEIDTQTMCMASKEYKLNNKSVMELVNQFSFEGIAFYEGHVFDEDLYSFIIKKGLDCVYKQSECVGRKIYKTVL